MFKRKMILLSLLIIGLLAFSSVCASDVNDTVVASDDQSDEILNVEDNNDIVTYDNQINDGNVSTDINVNEVGETSENELNIGSYWSFTNLANKITCVGDQLNLKKDDYFLYSSSDSDYQNGIKINKKITINGNGATISGSDIASIFRIQSDDVVLININFVHAGGSFAVNCYTNKGMYIENCSFQDLNITGSAVYLSKGDGCILKNCNFINCYSTRGGSAAFSCYGGVGCVVEYCNFSNCYAHSNDNFYTSSGGAIGWTGEKGRIINCIFKNCNACSRKTRCSGGAILWDSNGGMITNCSFVDCHCSKTDDACSGGAIYVARDNNLITKCTFVDCYSSSHNDDASFGGAIYVKSNNVTCNYLNFSRCYSDSHYTDGGTIYWDGHYGSLENSNFVDCFNSIEKGVITWNGNNGVLRYCNIKFNTKNTITSVINWKGNAGYLENCNVSNSSSELCVCWSGYEGILNNSNFINCSSSKYLVTWSIFEGTLNNSNFINCSSSNDCLISLCNVQRNGILSNTNFVNCSANGMYIVHFNYHGPSSETGTMYHCSFDGNYYNYESYCHYNYPNKAIPKFYINNDILNNNGKLLTFDITPLRKNITVKLYKVTSNISLFKQFNMSCESLLYSDLLNDLTFGEYIIELVYDGDNFYKNASANVTFSIKPNPSIKITEKDNIIAGDQLYIKLTLNNDSRGRVKISLLNQTYISSLNQNGEVIFRFYNIIGGNHPYNLVYEGDSNYNPFFITKNLNVSFINSTIVLDLKNNFSYGESILLNYNLSNECTGILSIFMDGVFLTNISVGNTFKLEDIDVGKHNLSIIYNGDNYHASCQNITKFAVNKSNTTMSIVNKTFFAGNTILNITLNNKCEGDMTLTIDKKNYTLPITEGNVVFIIHDLKIGNYEYILYYSGNQNFNPNTYNGVLSLQPQESSINISSKNIVEDNIVKVNYNITENVTGIISVYVNNSFINNVSVGEKIEINNLTVGKYSIKLIYNSDGFFGECFDIINLTVLKKSFIGLNLKPIYFDENIILKPIVDEEAFGKIEIYVDNTYQTQINVGNTYVLTGLTAGNHTIKVIYSGDDYFAGSENYSTLKVNKIDTTISVSPTKVIAGNTVLSITLNNKATGTIVVNVNNKKYNETLSSGKSTVYIYDLPAGEHNCTVIYEGDQNFNQNTIQNTLNIQIKESNIDITSKDCYFDEEVKVNYVITNSTTGKLSIYINDNFFKNVSVGSNINLGYLNEGDYTIRVVYNSDGYYATCEDSLNIKVKKYSSNFNAIVEDIYVDGYVYVEYNITSDAAGNINVYMDNILVKTVSVGCYIEFPNNLKAGLHTIKVIYSGDDYYASCEQNYI